MKLFGTDGVRGKAGDFLDAITVLKLAKAAGIYFRKHSTTKKILVGKDTRRSGYMIENALVSGLTAVGYDVIQIGPMPTPAIAYLTESMRCDAGIMISASHNPYEDNGIKFFDNHGDKLSVACENAIEAIFNDTDLMQSEQVTGRNIGASKRIDDVIGRYIVSIKSSFPRNLNLKGLRIVLDCANGAAYKVGPTILQELGADVIVVNNKPDGFNINEDCGAMHPEYIGKIVREYRADIGLALDGDADRLVVIDEKGEVVDGDKLIGALCNYLFEEKLLKGNGCVATVMSNKALEDYLGNKGIELFRSDVGDKYVLEVMKEKGINFGGEQSGHIIFSDTAKTGDGLASALQVLALIIKSGKKASEILNPFELYPQILHNMKVTEKIPLKDIKGLDEILEPIRKKGIRDLIRYSGTENKIRLLLEGKNKKDVEESMESLKSFFKKSIMIKKLKLAITTFIVVFIIDQVVKYGFANLAWDVDGPYMSLKLAYNYGVAFSMFSFLQHYLKFIQLGIVLIATIYLFKNKNVFEEYYLPISLLYAGGLSNILDRFTYGGVVDYFYWHYGFEFAIFNFADVIIDLAVLIIILKQIKQSKEEKQKEIK